jgi:DNA polymerase-3 subunit alpha
MLESLSKAGAFDGIYKNRRELLENSELLIKYANNAAKTRNTQQMGLFGLDDELDTTRPKLVACEEWGFQEMLGAEFSAFGFYLSKHPLESYAAKLAKLPLTESVDVEMRATFKGIKLSIAGVIISKKIRSSKKGKYALLQLSDRSGLLEFSVFNEQLLYKHEALLQPGNIVFLKVDARKDDNGLRVVADEIQDIGFALSNIKTVLEITISSHESIPLISSCLSNDGKIIRFKLQLPTGEEIIFGSKKQLFIDPQGEARLKNISGISFTEV